MAILISVGTSNTTSSSFTLSPGVISTVSLISNTAPTIHYSCFADVYSVTANGNFITGTLSGNDPIKVISGPGTFVVTRRANDIPFGVERN